MSALAPEPGWILDLFPFNTGGRTVILGSGRLQNGETFGFVDDRVYPRLYIRAADADKVKAHLSRGRATLHPSTHRTMDGETVCEVRVPNQFGLKSLNQILTSYDIRTYEGDLDLATRYRIEYGLSAAVTISGAYGPSQHVGRLYRNPTVEASAGLADLRIVALDIETSYDASRIFGFSLVSWNLLSAAEIEEVHIVGEAHGDEPAGVSVYPDEKSLLAGFRDRILALDPDILTGWNVIDFDLTVIERMFGEQGLTFNLGRTREASASRAGKKFGRSKMMVRGRQVLDALQLVRFSLTSFEDLRLDTVAKDLLGRGKTLEREEWQDAAEMIAEAYRRDRAAFCAYVLEDSRLVRDILRKERLIELTLMRSQLTALSLDRAWSSVVAFEGLYMQAMHRQGLVAPSWGVDSETIEGGTGGLVLEPRVGLYRNVLVFDFKSLYPSVMRTFNIDPVAHARGSSGSGEDVIEAPNGARFDRRESILPKILDSFFAGRAEAKATNDSLTSYTYKILMNSFYGVLATDACRFASHDIGEAITGFGQMLLRWMRDYFLAEGYQVLYGDTDSLFVLLPQEAVAGDDAQDYLSYGDALCARANKALSAWVLAEYGVASKLELEFEKYYKAFFLPPDRGGGSGRAKNYAGLLTKPGSEKLDVTGMEAVRSDWTPFARTMQKELLLMMMNRDDPEVMVAHIRERIKGMRAGRHDSELIYRKRIRKPLESYTKTTPPQIKAARLLPRPVKVVRYVMTRGGPEPMGFVKNAIDYDHYLDKQVRPIVEGLAPYADFLASDALPSEGPRGLQFSGLL